MRDDGGIIQELSEVGWPLAGETERLRGQLTAERRRFAAERLALQAKCLGLRDELARLIAYQSSFRFRFVESIHRWLSGHPWLLAVLCCLISTAIRSVAVTRWLCISSVQHGWSAVRRVRQRIMHRLRHMRNVFRALARGLVELIFLDSTMSWVRRTHGWAGVWKYASLRLRELLHGPATDDLAGWLKRAGPSPRLLRRFARRRWPADAPRFAVVLRLSCSDPRRLQDTLRSLAQQVYKKWHLTVLAPHDVPLPVQTVWAEQAAIPGRLEFISRETLAEALAEVVRSCRTDYLLPIDQGDALAPHALYRFADAVLRGRSEVVYCDSVHVGGNPDEPIALEARPVFSHDQLLGHNFLSHAVALECASLRAAHVHGTPYDDYDLLLHVVEHAQSVCHVPEVLYRRRASDSEPAGRGRTGLHAVAGHLRRLGIDAEVRATDSSHCRDVRFASAPVSRVAIIIPTKNQAGLLKGCLESLDRTVPAGLAEACVVDHESDDPETRAYLDELSARRRVLRYEGPFNFSAINNHAIARLGDEFTHYLFLNNDTEAISVGWLEHMLGFGGREDVGVVGALLLYPNRSVQHAGVIVGLHYGADHGHKHLAAYAPDGRRRPGPDAAFLASREQSAVTGACLLVRADVFRALGGFDEQLVVGFGDTDLCLRARERGLKVMLDTHAVLLHHESATRGSGQLDPHPEDTKRFRARHLQRILDGDDFYSPLLSRQYPFELSPLFLSMARLRTRTVRVGWTLHQGEEQSTRAAA